MSDAVIETDLSGLDLVHRGKVRDMYAIPGHDDKLLMVATDRISAYDVVMADAIPGKGKVLTGLSLFWFDLLGDIVENHLISADVEDFPEPCKAYRDLLAGRSMLVRENLAAARRMYCQGLYLGLILERLQEGYECMRFSTAGRDEGVRPFPGDSVYSFNEGGNRRS